MSRQEPAQPDVRRSRWRAVPVADGEKRISSVAVTPEPVPARTTRAGRPRTP